MREVTCPYCGNKAAYVDSEVIYGRSYGMVYLCEPCDAYVGVHKGTNHPLGRLADAKLRWWKKQAHHHFDQLWQGGGMSRKGAYAWLALKLNILPACCHIGMFDVDMCKRVCEESQSLINTGGYNE